MFERKRLNTSCHRIRNVFCINPLKGDVNVCFRENLWLRCALATESHEKVMFVCLKENIIICIFGSETYFVHISVKKKVMFAYDLNENAWNIHIIFIIWILYLHCSVSVDRLISRWGWLDFRGGVCLRLKFDSGLEPTPARVNAVVDTGDKGRRAALRVDDNTLVVRGRRHARLAADRTEVTAPAASVVTYHRTAVKDGHEFGPEFQAFFVAFRCR